jgi:dTDP-glucose 4,6-dehydratase
MRNKPYKLLVTGGAGFIGSEFVRQAVGLGHKVIVLDKMTYAADSARLAGVRKRIGFYKGDVCRRERVEGVMRKERPAALVHFAAETHVDRSIVNADPFVETNIKGTKVLMDAARKFGLERFIHISTDEVYGEIARGSFTESSPLQPNSPYAASKAAADLLVKAYIRTYDLPAIIIRPSNNYGPWQYPEKLIPLAILKASRRLRVPVYAKGKNTREWLFVSDCAKAILLVLGRGKTGQVYNIGSGQEKMNIEVVETILRLLDRPVSLIEFVKDRPGHDLRYSLNSKKLGRLGWKPEIKFTEGIAKTIDWYNRQEPWLRKHYGKKLSIKF